jgi:hypothetical protein
MATAAASLKKTALSLHKRQRRAAAMVGISVPGQTAVNAEVFAGVL